MKCEIWPVNMQNSCTHLHAKFMHTPPCKIQPIYFWLGTGTVGPSDYEAKWFCLFIISVQHSFHWIAVLNWCYFNAQMYIQMDIPTQRLNLTVHPSFLIRVYSLTWASGPPFSLVHTSNHPVMLGSSLFLFPSFLSSFPEYNSYRVLILLTCCGTWVSLPWPVLPGREFFLCWTLVLTSGYHGNLGVFFGFPEIQFCPTGFGGFDYGKNQACGKASRPQRTF